MFIIIMSLHPGTLVAIMGSDIAPASKSDLDNPSLQEGRMTISIFVNFTHIITLS